MTRRELLAALLAAPAAAVAALGLRRSEAWPTGGIMDGPLVRAVDSSGAPVEATISVRDAAAAMERAALSTPVEKLDLSWVIHPQVLADLRRIA
jgi:hypothetical protein